jgi:mannan endo-1,4-beta-mannosidase
LELRAARRARCCYDVAHNEELAMKGKFVVLVGVLTLGACSSPDPNSDGSPAEEGGGGQGGEGGDEGEDGQGGAGPTVDCTAEPDRCRVRVENGRFVLDGKPYRTMGTNFWAAPYIEIERLRTDLDLLQSLGVKNLRILALSEGGIPTSQVEDTTFGPQRIYPASSNEPCADAALEASAAHLEEVLDELDRRGMKTVLTLNNWYHWSGGMPQYVKWAHEQPGKACGGDHGAYLIDGTRDPETGVSLLATTHHVPFSRSSRFMPASGERCLPTPIGDFVIPHPNTRPAGSPDVAKAWDDQQDLSALFLCNARAQEFFYSRAAVLIERLKAHPAIMSWQLANEPRALRGWSALFERWVENTARFIKDIDPNHLVSIGAEGERTLGGDHADSDYRAFHDVAGIDYLTLHIWPENWGWYDPALPADSTGPGSLTAAMALSDELIGVHLEHARALGKPLVIEEFGLARDDKTSPVTSTVSRRNTYYENVFSHVANTPELGGVNFWAFAGAGRPAKGGNRYWRLGDDYTGDPPHEPQGWYSVYSTDADTLALIEDHAARITPRTNPDSLGSGQRGAPQ